MFYLYLLAADLKWPITICRTLCSLLKIRSQIKPKGQTDKHQHNSGLQVPECVTDSILEVDKVVLINPKQITCVEVQVSLFKYITEPLLLCLLLVPSVANEWRPLRYLPHQQSCLTWWTNTCHTTSNHHQSQRLKFQQLTFHKVKWTSGCQVRPWRRTSRRTSSSQVCLRADTQTHLWLLRYTGLQSSWLVLLYQCQTWSEREERTSRMERETIHKLLQQLSPQR